MKIHNGVKPFVCDVCRKDFLRKSDLDRHSKIHKPKSQDSVQFSCEKCNVTFTRRDNLKRHLSSHLNLPCAECDQIFNTKFNLLHHVRVSHAKPVKRKSSISKATPKRSKNTNSKTSLNVFTTHILSFNETNSKDMLVCFEEIRPELRHLLEDELVEKRGVKWYVVVKVQLSRVGSDGEVQIITPYFRSKCEIELLPTTIPEHIESAASKITQSLEDFVQMGSGWNLKKILEVCLFSAKYTPLGGSSYIPLSKKIQAKRAVLNIQNEDQKCLVWCLLAHKLNITREHNPHRVSHYLSHEHEIQLGSLSHPIPVTKIYIMEKLNNLRINVFGCEEDEVFPLYISEREDSDCINLLLISNDDRYHYCLIRNMSRLLSNLSKNEHTVFICYRCLHRFINDRLLQDHLNYCKNVHIQKIKMPVAGQNILEFNHIRYQHSVPFIIYADFESIVSPLKSSELDNTQSFTEKIARHITCGYAYVVIGPNGESVKPVAVYRGENAAMHFMKSIIEERETLALKLNEIKPMIITPQEELNFRSVYTCELCQKPLYNDRVRDHCHITGRYRGAVHNHCNLQYRMRKMIPVVFHNLKNYDAHMIMKTLGHFQEYECDVIAMNMEKYISFSLSKVEEDAQVKVKLQFIDSFQFLPTSLSKLVSNLSAGDFHLLKSNFPAEKIDLLLRKGIYPYEYINSFSKFEERSLPPIHDFYSSLSGDISEEDYMHSIKVWSSFQMKNLGEYHDLYVKSDTLQLADVFQNFRKLCTVNYGIDPAHLLTAPGLAWQASLKMTQQPLELLTDIDMHLFVEQGIRGGISTIITRYAAANNKYLSHYEPSKPSKYIMYLDANNLYGWAMSQPLPYGNFEWVCPEEMSFEKILHITPESETGYILEVDLIYPEHLHDLHNDYPLAPERITISEDMLSPTSKEILSKLNSQKFNPSQKLVPNLNNKYNYITYHRNLQLYISLGLKVAKIHKVLKFKQKPWLKSYIDFNTEKRKQASSSFEKDFFKLLNNSVFGKTMENIRKRRKIDITNNETKGKKLVASPSFHSFRNFDDNLVGVERTKQCITLNRPVYVGFVILELSKCLMYDFHYNYMKETYGNKAELLFTDTDSLTYVVETEDIYRDMGKNSHLFDTSEYPIDHPLHSDRNKKKIGCFKDELNSKIIEEFVGLRSKMYSIKSGESEKKTAKGVCKKVIKDNLKHSDYRECLLNMKIMKDQMHRISSDLHEIYTLKQNKTTLSCFDDKRFLLKDGIHSYAYGHHKIKEYA